MVAPQLVKGQVSAKDSRRDLEAGDVRNEPESRRLQRKVLVSEPPVALIRRKLGSEKIRVITGDRRCITSPPSGAF